MEPPPGFSSMTSFLPNMSVSRENVSSRYSGSISLSSNHCKERERIRDQGWGGGGGGGGSRRDGGKGREGEGGSKGEREREGVRERMNKGRGYHKFSKVETLDKISHIQFC